MSKDTEKDLQVDSTDVQDADKQTPAPEVFSVDDAESVAGGLHKVDAKSLFGKARR